MKRAIKYKRNLHTFNANFEINTCVGVVQVNYGWIAFTRNAETGFFETKEDAEMALLKMIFAKNYEEIEL